MPLDRSAALDRLRKFDFSSLFTQELGWNWHKQTLHITVKNGATFALNAIAQQKGVVAYHLAVPSGAALPDYATRRQIELRVSQATRENIVIYTDAAQTTQIWQWVKRSPGQPAAAREHYFHKTQTGEALLQKLDPLFVSLADEETLTLVDVTSRVQRGFDVERVTKAFYRDFDTHRKAFVTFIDGIGEVADREWYASVMLNRLMFVYFIQRKGFLDGDREYLRHRLARCKKEQGKDKFYSFYRYFLLRLFHEGFGKRRKDRAPDLEKLLGNIPYLNGGLFDVHELEKPERYGKDIQIADKAFERVFDYFDRYQWHLDERPLRADNEINPDVLGYIFEKYINQKQMGAYYTKEDITEYISKTTVLPFLFDAARGKCKVAFENPHGPTVWDLLCDNPDRYIYPAVRHGTDRILPHEIAAGLDATKPNLIERRQLWNKPAPADYALPTEIWREVVARRQRYEEVRRKIAAGEVREINDFITLNLDLRQFAQDVIQNCEGPDLLMALWQAITTITVLDPTGGSGAFIFAALSILEPLYEACLDRMEAFLAEWSAAGEHGKKAHPNYHKKFTDVLARVDAHPNRRYFVLKSIILNNLYAVDIMEEAVEICKLRLFLKLAAQVEPDAARDNLGIEPLPDIDFNIRAGNTLVGYATYDEVKRAITSGLDFDNAMEKIAIKAADLQQTFDKFRQLQTEGDGSVPAAHKLELQKRLKALEDELNRHLAGEYGVKVGDKAAYAQWVKSHQPFHWFIQFYGILNGGGFDAIVGNPPYVEYSKVRRDYSVRRYETESCGNLYAYVIERSFALMRRSGRMGMIVPLSLTFSRDFVPLRSMLLRVRGHLQMSSYDNIPDRLFTGAKESENTSKANQQRITIFTLHYSPSTPRVETSPILRWKATERWRLFGELPLTDAKDICTAQAFPKVGSQKMKEFLMRWESCPQRLASLMTNHSRHSLVVPKTAGYYIAAYPDEMDRTQQMSIYFRTSRDKDLAMTLLNSNAFFWLWRVYGDSFHVTAGVVGACPVFDPKDEEFLQIARKLYGALKECTVYKGYRGVDVPNVNFNKRMDLLWQADEWIIHNVAPDLGITPEDFLWGKSNSFFRLEVPKSANYPEDCGINTNDEDSDN